MKTETQIAEENIKRFKNSQRSVLDWGGKIAFPEVCKSHKASCQRFLEFLEKESKGFCSVSDCRFCEKIQDLKQAIKLYEDNGI